MAKRFAETSVTQQKKDATDLLQFLQEQDPDLAKLNVDSKDIAALVNIPDSDLVRVVYGFGHGTCGIGSTSPIDGKILICLGRESTLLGCWFYPLTALTIRMSSAPQMKNSLPNWHSPQTGQCSPSAVQEGKPGRSTSLPPSQPT